MDRIVLEPESKKLDAWSRKFEFRLHSPEILWDRWKNLRDRFGLFKRLEKHWLWLSKTNMNFGKRFPFQKRLKTHTTLAHCDETKPPTSLASRAGRKILSDGNCLLIHRFSFDRVSLSRPRVTLVARVRQRRVVAVMITLWQTLDGDMVQLSEACRGVCQSNAELKWTAQPKALYRDLRGQKWAQMLACCI